MANFSKFLLMQVSLLVAMSLLSSCIYDSLPECPDGRVEFVIENDWRVAPDADPEGMAYLFFREGVENPWRFDFPGRNAGKVALPPGEYEFVMYNNDTSHILFETDADGMPFATTESETLRIGDADEDAFRPPDVIWAASVGKVWVDRCGVRYSYAGRTVGDTGDFRLLDYPRLMTPAVIVRVLHVDNLRGVVHMEGLLSGMASGVDLYSGVRSDDGVDVAFDPKAVSDSSIEARFNTFGLPADGSSGNVLSLCFHLSDGRVVWKKFDVSEHFVRARYADEIEIVIDSIILPDAPPAPEGGGFDPTVVGWTTIEVNYAA